MKRPKRVFDVRNGIYIRADLNNRGGVILHTRRVYGKPFKENGEWKIKTDKYESKYLGDLVNWVYCFKYSAKLMAHLERISEDIFEFVEFISGEKIDESRRRLMKEDFEYESLLLDI